MFTKDELYLIFEVFANTVMDEEPYKTLKTKMALLKEQMLLADDTQAKISAIQDKIAELYKDDKNEEEKESER